MIEQTTQTAKIVEEIQQGVSLSEIARKYNISRQRVHQIKNRIGKQRVAKEKPTKKKKGYDARWDVNTKEQIRLYREKQKQKELAWNYLLPQAYEECRRQLKVVFPNLVTLLRFEHVDDGGYYFTFQLVNDARVQTHAIRHTDLQKENNHED